MIGLISPRVRMSVKIRFIISFCILITVPAGIKAGTVNYNKKHYLSIYGGQVYNNWGGGDYISYKKSGQYRGLSIGYGYDFGENWSFETRYTDLGKIDLVTKVGEKYPELYHVSNGENYKYQSEDNKLTFETKTIDFIFRRNYLYFIPYYGRFNFYFAIGPYLYLGDLKFHDGDYKKNKNVFDIIFFITPIGGIYRINDNLQMSYSFTTYLINNTVQYGIQYYFN